MKQVFIISGPNGCGKTILADKLVEEFKLPFINADNIAAELVITHIEFDLFKRPLGNKGIDGMHKRKKPLRG